MVKTNFLKILEAPKEINTAHAKDLKAIIDQYPYFQSVRALYLKALKNQESFKYNNELKTTAVYTTDRTILFNFITSSIFDVTNVKTQVANTSVKIEETNTVPDTKNVSEVLEIGKPLPFTKNETHSFNQWLQLSVHKPIIRSNEPEKITEEKSEKESIIDKFIASNPKITPVSKTATLSVKPIETPQPPQLMTETLAKVYLEQKKYDSAIKAYEILSLKYPEKSGFFADQIKRIQILQKI